jgi:predicted XRE-type DNA-binding protein
MSVQKTSQFRSGRIKNEKTEDRAPYVSRGNILDDLGFSPEEALEMRVKADLYRALLQHIQAKRLTQKQVATVLEIYQPDASNLLNGRISKFSVGKLIKFAGKLNLMAEIKISESPGATKVASLRQKSKARKRLAVA